MLEHIEDKAREDREFKYKTKIISTELNPSQDLIVEENPPVYKLKNQFLVISSPNEIIKPVIDIYFEDKEAEYIFRALIKGQKDINNKTLNKRINYKNVSLSCNSYRHLHNNNVDTFSKKSIICLDGDEDFSTRNMKNFIDLPTLTSEGVKRNPEEFIYDIISDEKSEYWKQTKDYNYSQFMFFGNNSEIIQIKQGTYDSSNDKNMPKKRELWKDWFKYQKTFLAKA